jgi:hypothetical protein
VEEAIYLHRKLRDGRLPFGGLIVNRVHELAPEPVTAVPAGLAGELGDGLTGRVEASARELAALAARDEAAIEHLMDVLGDPPAIVVPELEDDIHDVEGLALMRGHLFAQ